MKLFSVVCCVRSKYMFASCTNKSLTNETNSLRRRIEIWFFICRFSRLWCDITNLTWNHYNSLVWLIWFCVQLSKSMIIFWLVYSVYFCLSLTSIWFHFARGNILLYTSKSRKTLNTFAVSFRENTLQLIGTCLILCSKNQRFVIQKLY